MNVASPKLKRTPDWLCSPTQPPPDDLERRRELGQFFTSPGVTAFIWDMLEVIHGRRFSANTRLIDPACGQCIFLRLAHERGGLPPKNLFGADIDATLVSG